MGIGNRIRAGIGFKYPLLKDFCEATGVSNRTLQHYLSEKRGVSADFLTLLSEHIGVSASWILTGQGSMFVRESERNGRDGSAAPEVLSDFIPIKRYSVEASAGGGALVDQEDHSGTYAFHRKWLARRQLDPAQLAVIAVRGDSMEPKLSDGDLILVDRAQRQVTDGLAYVLRLGSDLLVKYVQRIGPAKVAILSANTFYPPREIDADSLAEEIEIIGRVVASMHEW